MAIVWARWSSCVLAILSPVLAMVALIGVGVGLVAVIRRARRMRAQKRRANADGAPDVPVRRPVNGAEQR